MSWFRRLFMSLVVSSLWAVPGPADEFPNFAGRTLNDKPVDRNGLRGAPTVVVITPDRKAAESIRAWLRDLRAELSQKVRVRDLIENNAPYFIPEKDVIKQAKRNIPKRYWNETWLVTGRAIGIELGQSTQVSTVYVYILDSESQIIGQSEGPPTEATIAKIKATLNAATAITP